MYHCYFFQIGKYECICPRNYVGLNCERYDASNTGSPQTTAVVDICEINGCAAKAQNRICEVMYRMSLKNVN